MSQTMEHLPAKKVQSPEFKPQYHQKQTNKQSPAKSHIGAPNFSTLL
jgi:hypothetical protein